MGFESQQTVVFNRILLNFLKEIRHRDDSVRQSLKEHYKVFDKSSNEYIDFLRSQITEDVWSALQTKEDIFDAESVLELQIFRTVTVRDIVHKIVRENDADRRTVKFYLYLLITILYFDRAELALTDNDRALLLSKTLRLLNGEEAELDEVLDDTLANILERVRALRDSSTSSAPSSQGELPFDMSFLENTKIGALAREISQNVDVSKLNPEDLMRPETLLTGGGDGVLGDLIQSVGDTIQSKLDKGEIDQEQLMQEAMSMLGSLDKSGHGGMMAGIFAMMKDGMPPMPPNDTSTRDRLRKKLANKKKPSL
jgi:hypothetical protein